MDTQQPEENNQSQNNQFVQNELEEEQKNQDDNQQKPQQQQQNNIDFQKLITMTNEELQKKDKDVLIYCIQQLKSSNQNMYNKIQHLNSDIQFIAHAEKNIKAFTQKQLDILKTSKVKKFAFRLMYFGKNLDGFAQQINTKNTVEEYLGIALKRSLLIQSLETASYSRGGRTDKGVSAVGNVIALNLRVTEKKNKQDVESQMNYMKIINGNLPSFIRALNCVEVSDNFNARHLCVYREYKYFFFQGIYNIEKMKEACKIYVGLHDFRNFCKVDLLSAIDFEREILFSDIELVHGSFNQDPRLNLYCWTVRANAFLMHQIRCMISILFHIGNGLEEISIIKDLFDINYFPKKPQYPYASPFSLVLSDCGYNDIKWQTRPQDFVDVYEHIRMNLQTDLIEDQLKILLMNNLSGSFKEDQTQFFNKAYESDKAYFNRKFKKTRKLYTLQQGKTIDEQILDLPEDKRQIYHQKLQKKIKFNQILKQQKNQNQSEENQYEISKDNQQILENEAVSFQEDDDFE